MTTIRQHKPDSGTIMVAALRYCDTGDVAAAVPGIRVAMLGELLGITVWQSDGADRLEALPLGGAVPPR
jgi:hypothetical protein